jgi:YidC/Oxa1 family membrane protein insertase
LEKRLPLFLFLSLLLLFAWNVCHPRPQVEQREEQQTPAEAEQGAAAAAAPAPPGITPDVADTEERTETFVLGAPGEPGYWRVEVGNRGGRLISLDFGSYYKRLGLSDEEKRDPENWTPLLDPVELPGGATGSLLLSTRPSSADLAPLGLDQVLWTMHLLTDEGGAPRGVEWSYGAGRGVVFTKRLTRIPGTYRLRFELELANTGSAEARGTELLLIPAGCVPQELGDKFYDEPRAIAVGYDAEEDDYAAEWESPRRARGKEGTLDVPAPLTVAGVHNKYFAFLLYGADDAGRAALSGAAYRPVKDPVWLAAHPGEEKSSWRYIVCDVNLTLRVPEPGRTSAYVFDVFAGPKDVDVLSAEHPAFNEVERTDLSGWTMFSSIGRFLLKVLRFFHGLVGNWGIAIILLTFCVRLVLFPVNRRSQTSMARYQTKMKRVQPRIEEVKKRYADNPQKLREEQARIMQEEGAFPPLGGCLPPFLQIPVFFGLFAALRTSFDLRQAPFGLWIDDLSRPDRLFEINLWLPLVGEVRYFNLLPILMVILWIVQQLGMPKPTDEQAARMQKMMMFMPVFMGVFLYNYAAGLSVYMITQSTLGIVEQRVIKKLWPLDEKEPEKKAGKRGCGPLSGALERLAEKHREEMKRVQSGAPRGKSAAAKAEKKRNRRL